MLKSCSYQIYLHINNSVEFIILIFNDTAEKSTYQILKVRSVLLRTFFVYRTVTVFYISVTDIEKFLIMWYNIL